MLLLEPEFWQVAGQPPTLKRGLKVAAVVGVILNLINQGDALWGDGTFNIVQALLTFCVPFCVSTYSAATFEIERRFKERQAKAGQAPVPED